ncbi:class I SAM-dependent methyltransferase [Crassaminicella profunda]|uniref:class I SAM-dependent methyltransferase n=1 Tax=Crassaminicella profunda TaxID=1286698 RepID=UPI001CA6B9B6|nr:class I SAM-dependent methyltransferase [Crassaminicella profunda]QZY54310.1 class I SAM-dependent methyltransferase [Crassaminicella profunda]
MDLKTKEWDNSYKNKDNFVFYPHEEVIRFVSKYVRKKTGTEEYKIIHNKNIALDLGCGIGRHVIYLDEMGLDAYGIDLSKEAIEYAKNWCKHMDREHLSKKLTIGSITEMPYDDNFFDFIVSHGVLDSMHFDIAKVAMKEVYRTLKQDGLFYFDLISGNDYEHPREYAGEEIVTSDMEKDTVQSYFNWTKINQLIDGYFKIEDVVLIQRESVIFTQKDSRYHIIARKI